MILKPRIFRKPRRGHWATKGLKFLMLFNEGSGNKVFDLSGKGNTGTFVNETFWDSSQTGSGIGADGSDDSIAFSWSKLGITGYPFSIVWAGTHHTLNSQSNFMTFSDADDNENSILVGIESNNKIISAAFGPGGPYNEAVTTQTIVAGERVMGTHVFRSNTDRRVYINGGGEAINTDADDVNFGLIDKFNLFTLERSSQAWILAKKYEFLYIYNRVLATWEIAELYRKPFAMFERDSIELWVGATSVGEPPVVTGHPYYYREIANRRIA